MEPTNTSGSQNITDAQKVFTAEWLKGMPEFTLFTYIETFKPIAKGIEAQFKINYLVPLIQSAHESRNGNSGLFRHYCNAFGMTATQWWKDKGRPVGSFPTDEYINGKWVKPTREFCAYSSINDSFQDWAERISRFKVYAKAYKLFQDGQVVDGIKEMGISYATDPAYAKKLVELYKLVLPK